MAKIALDRRMYKEAAAQRLNLTQWLERLDPSPEGAVLNALGRQLKERGILTRSDFAKGIAASTVEEAFYRTEDNDVLFPEVLASGVREVYVTDPMLSSLIGQYTTIVGNSYKTVYADDQPTKQSLKRVTEASELPKTKLVTRTQEVKIYKYGRAIEASYEVVRRMQIDLLALHVRRMAMQAAKDKVSEILTVIEDGDGNSNAASVIKLTDMDSAATSKTLTAKAWLAFLMEFEEFAANTVVASKDAFLQIMLTDLGSFTAAQALKLLSEGRTSGIAVSAPQLPNGQINLFWHNDLTQYEILGINNQYAIEQVFEAGSDINEADRFITNQTQVLTISENSGYAKVFTEATKKLDLNQ